MSIPQTLGKYDILKTLGKGGMGTVYLGYDRKLHRHVAIKTILRDELGGENMPSEYAQRFELEAKAIAKLNHPNIVSVYDSGEEGDTAYIVMEFIEGNDLKYYFDKQIPFDLSESLRLMVDLLEALAHAHDKGVWHRDIKPANVMIDTAGQLKLTDFGVSRIADTSERSRTGTMVGTLHYMSPEQVLNTGVSHRSDLFAAAVIMYQFLTRIRPFTGSEYEISHKIIHENAIPPSQVNELLPPQLDAVLAKAMAKQPDKRYVNAREFIAAIRAAVGEKQEPLLDVDATRHFYASHGSKNTTTLDPNPASNRRTGSKSASQGANSSMTSPSETAEIEFWRSIKDGNDVDEFSLYLTRFPNGTYAELARKRIERFAEGNSDVRSGVSSGERSAGGSGVSGVGGAAGVGATGGNTSGSSTKGSQVGNTRPGNAALEKREPTFGDFASPAQTAPHESGSASHGAHNSAIHSPPPPATPHRRDWQLPAAIVVAAGVIAAGLWLTRAPSPTPGTGPGVISSAPTQAGAPATPAPTAASPATPASGAQAANTTQTTAQPTAQPAAQSAVPVAVATPTPGPSANDKQAEKQRQEAQRLEALRIKEAALADKNKREEAAALKAREAIAAGDRPKPATNISQSGQSCVLTGKMKANTADKTEAELCAIAKGKASAWIANWKTPGGIAKGQDKFSDPVIGECACQSGTCSVDLHYSGPCNE
jgi:serine/threonine-protein kinase